ncbi:hypothetical protein J7E62_32935 [Variovorax paradoxus]|nr:hypothetical protein [Variovorax paradoxus]
MSRFPFLVMEIEILESGAFQWALFESFDDSSNFSVIARSELTFLTRQVAWKAGCNALRNCLDKRERGQALDSGFA